MDLNVVEKVFSLKMLDRMVDEYQLFIFSLTITTQS